MRNSSVVGFIGLALLSSIGRAEPVAITQPSITDPSYTKPDRLVDVGSGRMMNIRCRGSGSPAVIFDAGLGDDTISWALVQPSIARTTRACAYDRAGLGFSDGHPAPSTAANNAEDLHALLKAAWVEPPYILVGHSAGGMYVRVFADRHSEEVAGMVLVESSHENQSGRGWAIGAPGQKEKWDAYLEDYGECVARAREGLVKGTLAYDKCVGPPDEHLSTEINEARATVVATPRWQAAVDSERRAIFYASAEETRATRKRYGDLPLVVLTHSPYPKRDEETQEERDRRTLLWESLHTELAAMSNRGVNIIVPNTGHYIQYERPQVVIDAVRQAIMLARQRAE
jgi:pimeloyl-ACP methyl ester carboxylesterase